MSLYESARASVVFAGSDLSEDKLGGSSLLTCISGMAWFESILPSIPRSDLIIVAKKRSCTSSS